LRFLPAAELTPEALAAIAEQGRVRLLRWFARSGLNSPARYLWVMRLARLFESLPLVCPNCGADLRIVACITEAAPVARMPTHIGEPPRPPPISPARGPPAGDEAPAPMPDRDLLQQPEPDFEFDQRIAW